MRRIVGVLLLLIFAAFAIPPMLSAIESFIPILIAGVAITGVSFYMFQGRKRW